MTAMADEFADLMTKLPVFDITDVEAFRALAARLRPPREMSTHPDLRIDHLEVPGSAGSPSVRVRVYTPRHLAAAAPGLLYCHGGGFVLGNLDSDHERCLRLAAEAGVVVVSPDYRLAPEHRYPAGLDDCTAVLHWLEHNAADLGVDPSRLVLGGTSAGGALAAGVALRARDADGPTLRGLLLACPVTDDRLLGGSIREFWDCAGWNGACTALMWRHYLPDPGAGPAGSLPDYAAPNRAESLAGLPPTDVLVAGLDPLRDEGLAFVDRLRRCGVPTTVRIYPDVPHGFDTLLPTAAASIRAVGEQVTRLIEMTRDVALP